MNEFEMEDELYHHGVVGMKWGVRRYQNPDGSLTSKGKQRFEKTNNSNIRKKLDTSHATYTLKKSRKLMSGYSKTYASKSVKEDKKAEKYAKGTDAYNKHKKAAENAKNESKSYSIAAKNANKMLKEIETGKIKAGKDFIVQRDINVTLLNPAFGATREMGRLARDKEYKEYVGVNPIGYQNYKIVEKKRSR